jgi:hypothetical protein
MSSDFPKSQLSIFRLMKSRKYLISFNQHIKNVLILINTSRFRQSGFFDDIFFDIKTDETPKTMFSNLTQN